MLRQLKISRFKSLFDTSLEFGRVNLFIGGNGSGKSSILEAIGLLSACFLGGVSDKLMKRKGIRSIPASLAISSFKDQTTVNRLSLGAEFSGGPTYEIELGLEIDRPQFRILSERLAYRNSPVFLRSEEVVEFPGSAVRLRAPRQSSSLDISAEEISEFPDLAELVDMFSRLAIYYPQVDVLRGKVEVDASPGLDPLGIHGEGLGYAVGSFLRALNYEHGERESTGGDDATGIGVNREIMKMCGDLVFLPGWARNFGVRAPDRFLDLPGEQHEDRKIPYFKDRFMEPDRNELSVQGSSEGALLLIFAAILLGHPRSPKFLALDNVDNALNPRISRKLLERIVAVTERSVEVRSECGARQVFLTSHNPTAVDAFDIFDDEHRVFVVRRDGTGKTAVTRLTPPSGVSKEEWREHARSRNLSQLWLDDEIGGALGEEL